MRAVIIDRASAGGFTIADVSEPAATPSQAIVRVHAFSLNRGEIRRAQSGTNGARIGWDIAGTIERAAEDGSSPPNGTRVVGLLGLRSTGWAERAAVESDSLAALPDSVSFEVASTLPVAGLTALMTLDKRGSLTGRRVLVTGASGGVGHFALQIARASGAHATALVHREARRASVASYADAVVVGDDASVAREHGPFDIVLESVGGTTFATSLPLVAQDGMLVTFGTSAEKTSTVDVSTFYAKGGSSIYGFILFHEVKHTPAKAGFERLLALIDRGELSPNIEATYPFDNVVEATTFFYERNAAGKVVVTL